MEKHQYNGERKRVVNLSLNDIEVSVQG
jgi:hypothetical protein